VTDEGARLLWWANEVEEAHTCGQDPDERWQRMQHPDLVPVAEKYWRSVLARFLAASPAEPDTALREERDWLRAWADDLAAKVPPHVDGDESQEALTMRWVAHVGLIHCNTDDIMPEVRAERDRARDELLEWWAEDGYTSARMPWPSPAAGPDAALRERIARAINEAAVKLGEKAYAVPVSAWATHAVMGVLSAAPPEREAAVNAFLRWLVSMDDPGSGPGMEARRTVTLTQIIDRASDLLDDHPPEREAPTPASVRAAALRRIEQREATPGNPADGPYPASVGEVADELAGLVVELDAGPARGLVRELAARLPEREAPSREDVAVTLEQALLGSYDDPGDLIHPDSQIPAGEIQRLIHEAAVPMLAILFPVREDEQRADSCFEADVLADDEGGQE
jgi:hypothetical protein